MTGHPMVGKGHPLLNAEIEHASPSRKGDKVPARSGTGARATADTRGP